MYRLFGLPRTGTKWAKEMLEANFDIYVNTTNKHKQPIRDGSIIFLTIRNPYDYWASRKKMLGHTSDLETSISEYNEFIEYIYDCIIINYDKFNNNYKEILNYIGEQLNKTHKNILIENKIMNNNDRYECFESHILSVEEIDYIEKNINWSSIYNKGVDFLN